VKFCPSSGGGASKQNNEDNNRNCDNFKSGLDHSTPIGYAIIG
jgi:hypothetical protein